ncbi:MAG TPA: hypothetical protein PJ986_03870 [Gammaproteobacteria bacterium]|nr:hypothetical protein [Gammaproteobacteria bacterium]
MDIELDIGVGLRRIEGRESRPLRARSSIAIDAAPVRSSGQCKKALSERSPDSFGFASPAPIRI